MHLAAALTRAQKEVLDIKDQNVVYQQRIAAYQVLHMCSKNAIPYTCSKKDVLDIKDENVVCHRRIAAYHDWFGWCLEETVVVFRGDCRKTEMLYMCICSKMETLCMRSNKEVMDIKDEIVVYQQRIPVWHSFVWM